MPEEKKTEKKESLDKLETEKVEVPAKFKNLVETIEKMSVLELSELVKVLEKKFGVKASAPVAAAAVATGVNAPGAEAEEKTSFNVILKSSGAQKIAVIKAIREITGKGLKESKDIADKNPSTVKENVAKKDAEEIKKKLEAVGAQVELK